MDAYASGAVDVSDFHTGDQSTDRSMDSGAEKIASGQPITKEEAGAVMAGAAGYMGMLQGAAVAGPYFAALLAAEWAVVAGMGAMFKALGWMARGGAGTCGSGKPPNEGDPGWHAWEASGLDFEPNTDFEALARPVLKAFYEASNNCRAVPPKLTSAALLKGIAEFWNRTHAGPTRHYRGANDNEWSGVAPWFTAAIDGLDVNDGPPLATLNTQRAGSALEWLLADRAAAEARQRQSVRAGSALDVLGLNRPPPSTDLIGGAASPSGQKLEGLSIALLAGGALLAWWLYQREGA